MSVREYKEVGTSALVAMAGYTETSRVLRELFIRHKSETELANTGNAVDCLMEIEKIEKGIGKIMCDWFYSKDRTERFKLTSSSMTQKESMGLLKAIQEFCKEDEDEVNV